MRRALGQLSVAYVSEDRNAQPIPVHKRFDPFSDQNEAFRVSTLLLLRGTEKNRAHHGFNPGRHLLRGDAIGSLEPATCGSKNRPGSRGRE